MEGNFSTFSIRTVKNKISEKTKSPIQMFQNIGEIHSSFTFRFSIS